MGGATSTGSRMIVLLKAPLLVGMTVLTLGAAQPPVEVPAATDDETITVTGAKRSAAEVRHEAFEFVRRMGVVSNDRSAARWIDPVCPRAFGLAPEHARLVETRMRAIANTVGVPLAREKCRANIAVTFTADAGSMVRRIAVRSPKQLRWVTPSERASLIEGTAPIRWWYASDTRSGDGQAGADGPTPWTGGNSEGGGSILPTTGVEQASLLHYNSSLISTQSVRALTNATVVIDVERAQGALLDAVAAYAAMVAFAEVREGAEVPAGSILSLFGPNGAAVSGLTERDLAFLTSLYDLPLDRRASEHRRRLVRDIVEAATDS